MGQQIVYCNTCGIQILASDFEKGKAVTVLRKNYCKNCMAVAIEKSKPAKSAQAQDSETPRVKRTDGPPIPTSRRKLRETGRVPRATTVRVVAPRQSRTLLIIVGGVILAVAITLLLLLAFGGRSTR